MTAKCKKFVLLVLAVVFGLCLFAACSFEPSLDDVKKQYNLVASVTYHANGGYFEGEKESVSLYYQNGQTAINIGTTKLPERNITLTREGYTIGGWRTAAKDENGNVIYEDEEKGIVKLGDPVDFSAALKDGDEWDVYAYWIRNQIVQVFLALDADAPEGKITYKPENGEEKTYRAGDQITKYDFDTQGMVKKPSLNVITEKKNKNPAGFTFYEFYADEACTQTVEWPLSRNDSGKNVQIYAKFITGEWNFISTVNDLISMLQKNSGGSADAENYYFRNDIDCTLSQAIGLPENHEFAGEIRGNGYKISNLKISQNNISGSFSLFGKLSATAKISDLTLENVSMTLANRTNASIRAYLFSHEIESGAKITNVNIIGGLLTMRFNGDGSYLFNGKLPAETTECPIYASAEEQPGIICDGNQIYKS